MVMRYCTIMSETRQVIHRSKGFSTISIFSTALFTTWKYLSGNLWYLQGLKQKSRWSLLCCLLHMEKTHFKKACSTTYAGFNSFKAFVSFPPLKEGWPALFGALDKQRESCLHMQQKNHKKCL